MIINIGELNVKWSVLHTLYWIIELCGHTWLLSITVCQPTCIFTVPEIYVHVWWTSIPFRNSSPLHCTGRNSWHYLACSRSSVGGMLGCIINDHHIEFWKAGVLSMSRSLVQNIIICSSIGGAEKQVSKEKGGMIPSCSLALTSLVFLPLLHVIESLEQATGCRYYFICSMFLISFSLLWNWSYKRVYYTLAVWRFKPFLSVGLWVHSYLSGSLWSRNYWQFWSWGKKI